MKPQVLVVDDTLDNLSLMQALMEDLYEVRTAASGAEALEKVRAKLPDLILLDVMMPGMDGHEVLRRLQSDAKTAAIPVIFHTALSSPEELQAGFALGATDYITKPISVPIMLARVQAHVERSMIARRLGEVVPA